MPRVLNKYLDQVPKDAINIMRPGPWGNPFIIGIHGTREDVIWKYRNWLKTSNRGKTLTMVAPVVLKGKDLVCCCAPKACHGDVLLEIANAP